MAFSADDFIVKIALQVDDSQLKQAMKEIDALGLSSHNKASSRAANQNSEFVGPPQRVRQHAYDSDPDRPGQGKDNLRNVRIRAQTALDFLRWPSIISAGVVGVVSPLVKLYTLTEKWQADLLKSLSSLHAKSTETNLTEREVLIAEGFRRQTPLSENSIQKTLGILADIQAKSILPSSKKGTLSSLGFAEVQGIGLNSTLAQPDIVGRLSALRNAVKDLSKLNQINFSDYHGLPLEVISYLAKLSDIDFKKYIENSKDRTIDQQSIDKGTTLIEKQKDYEALAQSKIEDTATKDLERKLYDAGIRLESRGRYKATTFGNLGNAFEQKALTFLSYIYGHLLGIERGEFTPYEEKNPNENTEQEGNGKKQPINIFLEVNGQLKDGQHEFINEFDANNNQTFSTELTGGS